LPVEWSSDRNVRWKVSLPGRGLSCPVITNGRVFVTACSGFKQKRLHVLCFREEDGTKLWERQFTATGNTHCNDKTCMAAPTPATDGKAVYALFATGDVAGLDLAGNLLWYRSLVYDYPDITNQVGMAASPVVSRGVLLLPMENSGDSFAAGLDTGTGKTLWKAERVRTINWVTPLVVEREGRSEAIFQTTSDVTAYDPSTGKLLWSLTGKDTAQVPSPAQGEGLLFVAGRDFLALKPNRDGGAPSVVWKSNRLPLGMTSPVYHQGRVYGLKPNIGLACLDARTGELLWQQRVRGEFSASPVIADGKAYLANENGVVTVVRLGQEPKVLAENDVGQTLLATPAIAGGAIYLRSDKTLFCIGAKKGK
jgi:outer membrane protein assembly factor BamB